jgi:hypothetical protein
VKKPSVFCEALFKLLWESALFADSHQRGEPLLLDPGERPRIGDTSNLTTSLEEVSRLLNAYVSAILTSDS